MDTLSSIQEALLEIDQETLIQYVSDGLHEGLSASSILDRGLIPAMEIIGTRMKDGSIFVPEVLQAARIMEAGMELLKPHLRDSDVKMREKVVIGTVKGDIHDIGKNVVKLLLQSVGFEVYDLGVDVAPERFAEAIKEHNADLVGLSALLNSTMLMMPKIIEAITEKGLRSRVKIMVGGAVVTQSFADKIGADGFAPEAGSAVNVAKELCKKRMNK